MSGYFYEYQNNKELREDKVVELNKYLAQTELIEIDNFIFDKKSLNSEIILSKCLRCEKYQGENCCGGAPYSFPEENRKRMKEIAEKAIGLIPENFSRICSARSDKFFTKSGSITTKGNPLGHCVFSYRTNDGVLKCAIHAYCIENNLDPTAYKPYTCSLFPLFVIRTSENKIIFLCHTKETSSFSPYWYTLSKRFCVNKDDTMKAKNGMSKNKYYTSLNFDVMKEDNVFDSYRPAYIEQENILKYFITESVYSKLIESMKL